MTPDFIAAGQVLQAIDKGREKEMEARAQLHVSAHAGAAAEMLRFYANQLDHGTPPEDIGQQVEWVGTMMARKI